VGERRQERDYWKALVLEYGAKLKAIECSQVMGGARGRRGGMSFPLPLIDDVLRE
jgi:hypothetical protein